MIPEGIIIFDKYLKEIKFANKTSFKMIFNNMVASSRTVSIDTNDPSQKENIQYQ